MRDSVGKLFKVLVQNLHATSSVGGCVVKRYRRRDWSGVGTRTLASTLHHLKVAAFGAVTLTLGRKRIMKNLAIASTVSIGIMLGGVLNAQETTRFGASLGAGFTTPVGGTGSRLDTGWNIRGGAGYNFSPYVGAMLDLGYDSFGLNTATLTNVGVPGGGVHIFSATLNPIVHLNPRGHADVYVTGGGGLYHRYVEFTQPTVAVTTVFDPFFGFYPVAFGTNQILGSYSVNKPGIDAGLGVSFGTRWHGKVFAEARYNRIFMGDRHTDYLPVTFGFRW
jgi:hypothetical protein